MAHGTGSRAASHCGRDWARLSADRLIQKLQAENAALRKSYERLREALGTGRVAERLATAAPAVAAQEAGDTPDGPQVLKRNVALHSKELPRDGAPLSEWRRAQRGPRIGTNLQERGEHGGSQAQRGLRLESQQRPAPVGVLLNRPLPPGVVAVEAGRLEEFRSWLHLNCLLGLDSAVGNDVDSMLFDLAEAVRARPAPGPPTLREQQAVRIDDIAKRYHSLARQVTSIREWHDQRLQGSASGTSAGEHRQENLEGTNGDVPRKATCVLHDMRYRSLAWKDALCIRCEVISHEDKNTAS